MAIICAVGDGLQNDPTFVSHLLEAIGGVPIRMVSQAAARRNITLVIREADLRAGARARARRFFSAASQRPRSQELEICMRILLIGHGRMGQLVERSRRRTAARSPASSPSRSARRRDRARRSAAASTSAIDFSLAGAVPTEPGAARRARASTSSSARPAGRRTKRGCARSPTQAGIGVLASANFSLGMHVFRARRRGGRAAVRRAAATSAPGSTRRITRPRRTRRRARR